MPDPAAGPNGAPAVVPRERLLARAPATARRLFPIFAVVGFALAALAVTIVLHQRTDTSLRAQTRLASFESAARGMQDIPWTLAAPPGQAPARATVARELATAEQNTWRLLREAQTNDPSRALRGIETQLRSNISANEQILAMIANGRIADTRPVNDAGTGALNAAVKAIEAARSDYSQRATTSLTQATLGSAAAIVVLIVLFLVLYRLSIKAREDRFQRAEAERASRAKSEFLSRVSHELRTPLNSILGFAQIIARSELDDRQRGNIERVRRAGRHLVDLINEVLDISRIESGDLRLSLESLRFGSIVDEVLDLVGPQAEARGITVTADPSCADAWIRADVQRIKQVLLNLVSNAVKYNRTGGRVTVSTAREHDRVRLLVADDGPGIPPEMMARIFSPFERLGAEATPVEGTGLGLALSKGFVEAMGGSISVESSVGVGSTFTVKLAAAEPRPGRPRRTGASVAPEGAEEESRHKILYIEDNVSNLDLVQEVFADRHDISLVTAVQGTLGVSLAREHQPKVVLLDLNLPDVSGEVVLDRLRTDPATAGIPVIVVTADATPGAQTRVHERGAVACLTKPIDVDELLRAVDEALFAPAGEAA